MTAERGFRVRALGEIALRCRDIRAMEAFYRDVIGLEPLPGAHRDGIAFFRLGESYGGHTAVLALFRDEGPVAASEQSSLHHLALTVDRGEQDSAVAWFLSLGIDCRVEAFAWIGWRGVFVKDPEGNTVELVAYDPALAGTAA